MKLIQIKMEIKSSRREFGRDVGSLLLASCFAGIGRGAYGRTSIAETELPEEFFEQYGFTKKVYS